MSLPTGVELHSLCMTARGKLSVNHGGSAVEGDLSAPAEEIGARLRGEAFPLQRKNRAPLARGNRYSRGPCGQVQTVDSLRMSGYDGYWF